MSPQWVVSLWWDSEGIRRPMKSNEMNLSRTKIISFICYKCICTHKFSFFSIAESHLSDKTFLQLQFLCVLLLILYGLQIPFSELFLPHLYIESFAEKFATNKIIIHFPLKRFIYYKVFPSLFVALEITLNLCSKSISQSWAILLQKSGWTRLCQNDFQCAPSMELATECKSV